MSLYRLSNAFGFSLSRRGSGDEGRIQTAHWRAEALCKDGGKRETAGAIVLSRLWYADLFCGGNRSPGVQYPRRYRAATRRVTTENTTLVSFGARLGQEYRADDTVRKTEFLSHDGTELLQPCIPSDCQRRCRCFRVIFQSRAGVDAQPYDRPYPEGSESASGNEFMWSPCAR